MPKFGDIYLADLVENGHVQGGRRPVLIAQNNIGNAHSPCVEILPLSSRVKAKHLPTHPVILPSKANGLSSTSVVLAEQAQTINKTQLLKRIGSLANQDLNAVGQARKIQSPFF